MGHASPKEKKMENIIDQLHRDTFGQFWIKLEDDDEVIQYCEDHDDLSNHETIQQLYEECGWFDYMDEERWEEYKESQKAI
jgi:hypothetical protein